MLFVHACVCTSESYRTITEPFAYLLIPYASLAHQLEYLCLQVHTLEAAMEDSKQAQHRAGQEHQHALLALQGQLNNAVGEMDVLRAGAGHAKDEALAALKVCWHS